MASIRMVGLVKRFGDVTVVPSIDLEIRDQEFIVFVGPSGCGKSTLLRVIAGLEPIDAGDLYIGDARVNDMSPSQRDIAMVFQDYALYPHMTVYDNMAFGLETRATPRDEIERRVQRAAGLLRIEPYLQRKPKALSGGQRQRVAMGRAMVRNPKVFLFDEPLSNLDAKLRGEVRTEIKALSQQLKTTMVFVTHDQVEAMTMADRIVVLKAGVVQQVGTPAEVYGSPANQFVAGFIGSPTMNFFAAEAVAGAVRLRDGALFPLAPAQAEAVRRAPSASLVLGVRPEHLAVRAPGEPGLQATVSVVEPLGSDTLVYFDRDGTRHVARVSPETRLRPGDGVTFGVAMDKAHLFDAPEGRALR
jgi:multiple sugar transport system ATP-binding protein